MADSALLVGCAWSMQALYGPRSRLGVRSPFHRCAGTGLMPRTKSKNDDPYSRGLALAREGRHADAIPCFEAALLQHPQDARVYFALGNTADAIGHHEAAENFF